MLAPETVLERAYEAGKVTKEVLDGVLALGRVYEWLSDEDCMACIERAKEGFTRLLGEKSAKVMVASNAFAACIESEDERIEFRRLWEMVKVSVPDEKVTDDVANNLEIDLAEKRGQFEESKVFMLAAWEGYRRVLGEGHKKTFQSLGNLGNLTSNMGDDEEALDYYQQALRGQEKGLGKTHPDNLKAVYNMAITYIKLKDFTKAEEMYRHALAGYENSLGKDAEAAEECAGNLASAVSASKQKASIQKVLDLYPHLNEYDWDDET